MWWCVAYKEGGVGATRYAYRWRTKGEADAFAAELRRVHPADWIEVQGYYPTVDGD